jgi:hypothetical protein
VLSWEDDNLMRPNGTYNYSGDAGIYNEPLLTTAVSSARMRSSWIFQRSLSRG